jgi:hypothetical protein
MTTDSWQEACRQADARRANRKKKAAERVATNGGAKPETTSRPPSVEELEAAAGDLIFEPDILTRLGVAVESAGLVGETNNAKILYLALTSRLFERPVSVAIKGVSAGGKSFTVEQVLKFFPPDAFFERTGMSEKAIIYSDENFRHRFLVIYEAAGMNSDMMSYLIRTLLSEGRVVYEVVEKTKLGLRPRRIEKEGPTGLITTTTAPKLHPENETRLLSLGVIDTQDQTKAVMQAIAAENTAKANAVKYAPWRALQTWLATGDRQVVVPFGDALASLIPPVAVRLRRDFKLLLTLIRAHALLHRETRERDDAGRIVATMADYVAVRVLVEKLFAEGIEATVPKTMRETVTAVREAVGALEGQSNQQSNGPTPGEVSLTALAQKMKLDKNSVHHRVRKAIDRGYLVNREEKRGLPARIAIADPLPDEIQILPPAESLWDCWSVGATQEGIKKEEEEADEGGESEAKKPLSLLPPNQHSNTPTPLSAEVCDYCGHPADHQALQTIADDWRQARLHRRCERPWFDSAQERPLGNAAASETGTCRVRISEIVVPAIAAAPDDDIFDIDPEWRR